MSLIKNPRRSCCPSDFFTLPPSAQEADLGGSLPRPPHLPQGFVNLALEARSLEHDILICLVWLILQRTKWPKKRGKPTGFTVFVPSDTCFLSCFVCPVCMILFDEEMVSLSEKTLPFHTYGDKSHSPYAPQKSQSQQMQRDVFSNFNTYN